MRLCVVSELGQMKLTVRGCYGTFPLEGELRNGAGFVSEHGAACARLTVRASLLKADAAVAASALVYSTTWQSLSARIQRQHS